MNRIKQPLKKPARSVYAGFFLSKIKYYGKCQIIKNMINENRLFERVPELRRIFKVED